MEKLKAFFVLIWRIILAVVAAGVRLFTPIWERARGVLTFDTAMLLLIFAVVAFQAVQIAGLRRAADAVAAPKPLRFSDASVVSRGVPVVPGAIVEPVKRQKVKARPAVKKAKTRHYVAPSNTFPF